MMLCMPGNLPLNELDISGPSLRQRRARLRFRVHLKQNGFHALSVTLTATRCGFREVMTVKRIQLRHQSEGLLAFKHTHFR